MRAARALRVEDRDRFLRLVADQVKVRNIDLADAVRRAVNYLQQPAGEQNHAA
jgi:hypothetical protein